MNSARYIIAFLLILILIIIVKNYNLYGGLCENYIYGYWVADSVFCEDSGCKEMLLFIGEPIRKGWGYIQRNCHLVINDDISNQIIKIKYKPWSSGLSSSLGKCQINTKAEFEENPVFPENITLEVDMAKGTLRIYDKEKIYGYFYKDHEITNMYIDEANSKQEGK